MHEVVPKAVSAAVKILTSTWISVLQESFFILYLLINILHFMPYMGFGLTWGLTLL